MKRRELLLLVLGLGMIGSAAAALQHLKAIQRLGPPGIKSTPIAGELRRNLEFPTNVTGYTAELLPVDKIVSEALPADTSIAEAGYTDPAGQRILTTAVMMGMDRTSIHQPQFCLRGQGWTIDESRSAAATVHLDRPQPVDLPVMKLISHQTVKVEGREMPVSSVYVYWFVAGDAVTGDHWRRMWWMAENLVRKGELQRWAYISYFTTCAPGQEEAAFERIKHLMNATVPGFQLAWPGGAAAQGGSL
jgi:hypothetical protein